MSKVPLHFMGKLKSHGGFDDELLAQVKAQLSENLDFSEQQEPSARNKAGMPSTKGFIDTHFKFGEGTAPFDYTTCQRSDGSYYGSSGRCIKGSDVPGGVPDKGKKSSSGGGGGGGSMSASSRAEQMRQINAGAGRGGGVGREGRSEVGKKGIVSDKEKAASAKSGGGGDTKQLRKDMISARDAEKAAKAERKTREDRVKRLDTAVKRMATRSYSPSEVRQEKAELATAKEKAATARKAHIDSKKNLKAATEKFQKGQASNNDPRRFGRSDERDKATNKQLNDALKSGKLSPRKTQAVESELRMRKARGQ